MRRSDRSIQIGNRFFSTPDYALIGAALKDLRINCGLTEAQLGQQMYEKLGYPCTEYHVTTAERGDAFSLTIQHMVATVMVCTPAAWSSVLITILENACSASALTPEDGDSTCAM